MRKYLNMMRKYFKYFEIFKRTFLRMFLFILILPATHTCKYTFTKLIKFLLLIFALYARIFQLKLFCKVQLFTFHLLLLFQISHSFFCHDNLHFQKWEYFSFNVTNSIIFNPNLHCVYFFF